MIEETTKKLNEWLKNDHLAVAYCQDIIFIAHLWDDLIDKDKPRSDFDISCAFIAALSNIPKNPFYRQYAGELQPVMMSAILQWQTANVLEKGSQDDRNKAFMLRASILQIFQFCAYLVGGLEWANKVGPDIMRFYNENINSYMKGKENA